MVMPLSDSHFDHSSYSPSAWSSAECSGKGQGFGTRPGQKFVYIQRLIGISSRILEVFCENIF